MVYLDGASSASSYGTFFVKLPAETLNKIKEFAEFLFKGISFPFKWANHQFSALKLRVWCRLNRYTLSFIFPKEAKPWLVKYEKNIRGKIFNRVADIPASRYPEFSSLEKEVSKVTDAFIAKFPAPTSQVERMFYEGYKKQILDLSSGLNSTIKEETIKSLGKLSGGTCYGQNLTLVDEVFFHPGARVSSAKTDSKKEKTVIDLQISQLRERTLKLYLKVMVGYFKDKEKLIPVKIKPTESTATTVFNYISSIFRNPPTPTIELGWEFYKITLENMENQIDKMANNWGIEISNHFQDILNSKFKEPLNITELSISPLRDKNMSIGRIKEFISSGNWVSNFLALDQVKAFVLENNVQSQVCYTLGVKVRNKESRHSLLLHINEKDKVFELHDPNGIGFVTFSTKKELTDAAFELCEAAYPDISDVVRFQRQPEPT